MKIVNLNFKCPPDYSNTWSLKNKPNRAISVGGTEAAFLYQKCEFSEDWKGPTIMETLLLIQYLTQCEGPLWNAIRGKGLAYGANIYLNPDQKAITLSLYRCAQICEAYEQTKKTVVIFLIMKHIYICIYNLGKNPENKFG